MKSLKLIALSVFLTLSVFCIVIYGSCSKDGCKGVTCLNHGTCGGGLCTCIGQGGIGGTNCELVYRNLYSNTYAGNATDSAGAVVYFGTKLFFSTGTDTTNYNNMDLLWHDPGTGADIVFNGIILSNNLSTGSNFTIVQTTTFPDSFTYNGTGSVNGNVASLSLIKTNPHITPKFITFNNFNKQ